MILTVFILSRRDLSKGISIVPLLQQEVRGIKCHGQTDGQTDRRTAAYLYASQLQVVVVEKHKKEVILIASDTVHLNK